MLTPEHLSCGGGRAQEWRELRLGWHEGTTLAAEKLRLRVVE